MKNWLLALFSALVLLGVGIGRALARADTAPRTCGSQLNSAGTLGSVEPPVPSPLGSPLCAMKPSITRWNCSPS